jgi:hypothetical protein
MMVNNLREELEVKIADSIRIALLEAGVAPRFRGVWRADEKYSALDICVLDGTCWIAKITNPGPLPGEGWALLSHKGERGRIGLRGERGEKGDPGEDGRSINVVSWIVNPRNFTVMPKMADGSFAPSIDLMPLFQAYDRQVRGEPPANAAAPSPAKQAPTSHAEPPLRIEMLTRAAPDEGMSDG